MPLDREQEGFMPSTLQPSPSLGEPRVPPSFTQPHNTWPHPTPISPLQDFGLDVTAFRTMVGIDCPAAFLQLAFHCCSVSPSPGDAQIPGIPSGIPFPAHWSRCQAVHPEGMGRGHKPHPGPVLPTDAADLPPLVPGNHTVPGGRPAAPAGRGGRWGHPLQHQGQPARTRHRACAQRYVGVPGCLGCPFPTPTATGELAGVGGGLQDAAPLLTAQAAPRFDPWCRGAPRAPVTPLSCAPAQGWPGGRPAVPSSRPCASWGRSTCSRTSACPAASLTCSPPNRPPRRGCPSPASGPGPRRRRRASTPSPSART